MTPWPVALECGHKIASSTPSHLLFIYLERDSALSPFLYNPLPAVQAHSLSSNKSLSASLCSFSSPPGLHLGHKLHHFFSPHNPWWDDSRSSISLFNLWTLTAHPPICQYVICECVFVHHRGTMTTISENTSFCQPTTLPLMFLFVLLSYETKIVVTTKWHAIHLCRSFVVFHSDYWMCVRAEAYLLAMVLHTLKLRPYYLNIYSRWSGIRYSDRRGQAHRCGHA